MIRTFGVLYKYSASTLSTTNLDITKAARNVPNLFFHDDGDVSDEKLRMPLWSCGTRSEGET